MLWARACAGWFFRCPTAADGEIIVHELSTALQQAGHDDAVKSALIDAVRRLTGASSVRWEPGTSGPERSASGTRELPLYAGRQFLGRLLVAESAAEPSSSEWPPETRRRLETVCTMAAYALARNGGPGDARAPRVDPTTEPCRRLHEGNTPSHAFGEPGERARDHARPALQDATFLSAVLPYAFGQAQRHGEPLSLLCLCIDRLHGIQELLGEEAAARAVQNVGAYIVSQLRSSDIVARIADERIVVLLPRARTQGALHVAQKICRSVETNPGLLAELPCLTVSIGVAEFPGSAQTVEGLLDAADAALGQAKDQGRNRAVAAPALARPERGRLPSLAS